MTRTVTHRPIGRNERVIASYNGGQLLATDTGYFARHRCGWQSEHELDTRRGARSSYNAHKCRGAS
jgi:hypothetical protein